MNANPANPSNIADTNVERLLTQSYRPEPVDPAFASRVQERMLAVANAPRAVAGKVEDEKLRRVRRRLAIVMTAGALAASVALVWHALTFTRPGDPRAAADPTADFIRLTPRARQPVAEAKPVAVGEEIRTRQGQRRRVTLPDGSILYVNQNSEIKIEGDRQLRLIRGEVFVEVNPSPPSPLAGEGHHSPPSPLGGEGPGVRGRPFILRTPHKEVTALGTKFAVRTDDHIPTQVLVTQGKVQVSGVREPVPSGQEMDVAPNMEATVRAAPRVSAVLDWARELMVAAESPLVPGSNYAGGALVARDPDGQEAKLSLRNYHVDVHIEDGFARTVIDQTYFNHNHSRIEGTFYFPLPPDASLSRLAMYVDGKLMEGGMAERDYARGVYDRIVWSQKDPALLEWVDGSTFKMRVFPLEARQEKRIIIGYTQRLAPVYGRTQYRFPAGHNLGAVADWSFQARVKNGTKLVCASDSHTLKTRPDGADLLLETKEKNVKLDRDVTLSIVNPAGPAASKLANPVPWAFTSALHEDSRYVMLRFSPDLPTKPQRQNRDWVFLFESSGDRDPLLARTQIEVLRGLLANAEHYDSFAVVTAATRTRTFPENGKLLPVTPDNVKSAIAFLESTHLIGALDLGKALAACAPLLKSAQQPHLVHLGSGVASMGERKADQLVQRIPASTRYVGVGIGKRWARDFMKSAAEKTGGHFTQINPDESVSWRSFDLAATLNTPRLMNAQVLPQYVSKKRPTPPPADIAFLAYTTNLAHGEELLAIARLGKDEPLPFSVRILGSVDGEPFEQELLIDPLLSSRDKGEGAELNPGSPLPRTWAKLEIDRLLAENTAANRERVINLSKAMYVMSPFTSLLVLENDEMYREHKIDRGRKDHWAPYASPERIEVLYEPEAGMPVDARFAPKTEKPHANAVLDTILVRVPPRWVAWPGQDRPYGGEQVVTALRMSKGDANANGGFRYDIPAFGGNLDTDQVSVFFLGGPQSEVRWGGVGGPPTQTQSKIPYRDGTSFRNAEGRWGPNGAVNFLLANTEGTNGGPSPNAHLLYLLSAGERHWAGSNDGVPVDFGGFGYDARRGAADGDKHLTRNPRGMTSNGMFRIEGYEYLFGAESANGEIMYEAAARSLIARQSSGVLYRSGQRPVAGMIDLSGSMDIDNDEHWNMAGKFFYRKQVIEGEPPVEFPPAATWSEATRLRDRGEHMVELGDIGRKMSNIQRRLELTEGYADIPQVRLARLKKITEGLGVLQDGESPWFVDMGIDDSKQPAANTTSGKLRSLSPPPRPRLYERPSFSSDGRVFSDLVSYAPGLNTSRADVLAVREAESLAGLKAVAGEIDPAARELIARARQGGWRRLGPVVFDASGRYAVDRTIGLGLNEQIVCDGKTLVHLYPEVGVGARRQVSRFHRAELARLVPWLVPPVEDLAIGRDVRKLGDSDSTIALVPRGAETRKDGDGKLLPYLVVHLAFAPDGRLAERRLVLMPENKMLAVQAYDASGVVRFLDGKRELVATLELPVREAAAPDLKPDASGLVVLPLPYRTREQVYQSKNIETWTLTNADFSWTYDFLDQETALELFATEFAQGDRDRLRRIHRRCFAGNGVHKLGFYTFLVSAGADFQGDKAFLDLVEKDPESPLARYQTMQGRVWTDLYRWTGIGLGRKIGKPDTLLQRLAGFRDLHQRWDWLRSRSSNSHLAARDEAIRVGLDYVKANKDSSLGWLMLTLLQDRKTEHAHSLAIAQTWPLFADRLGYIARYEEARCLYNQNTTESVRKWTELYHQVLKLGILPPVESDFVGTLRRGDEKSDAWTALVKQTADQLLQAKNRPAVVSLAWQCWQLGDQPLAQSLLAAARKDLGVGDDAEVFVTNMAAVEFLLSVNQDAQADEIISPMLAHAKFSKSPYLWRIGAKIAERRGNADWSISRLEQALELEYQDLPDRINLRQVRDDYGKLLSHYRYLIDASAALKTAPPKDLAARTVRAADRWRALDREETSVCDRAAEVLQRLGARELAWDYLTTPVGMKPNESAPWQGLAGSLSRQGDFALADLAYQSAFEADPNDVQILWDRGENLRRAGQESEARKLLRQIADGAWQPRFNGLQTQAKWRLEGR